MHRLILILLASLLSCTQTTPPPSSKVLGAVRLEFSVGDSRISKATIRPQALTGATASSLELQRISTSSFTTGSRSSGGQRWVSATYNVRNFGSSSLNNLSFLAVSTPTGLGQSAVAEMRDFGGGIIADPALAQAFKPTHAMYYDPLENRAVVVAGGEDFQAFSEAEVSSFAASGVVPLNYGFVVRNPSTPASRVLPANAVVGQFDGRVTFAMRLPLQASAAQDPFTFSMDFLVVTDDTTRVTQSLEQQVGNTIPSQTSALGAVVTTLPSSRYVATPTRTLTSVRLAKAENDNPIYLVKAENIITVTSNADSGAGSLRQAIVDVAPNGTIDLSGISGSIFLSSSLVIAKSMHITDFSSEADVRVLGGGERYLTSNIRVFEVMSGATVVLSKFGISNGAAQTRGGGLLNAGHLTLSNMRFVGNLAYGIAGQDGAIGQNGQAGGDAFGGAVYSTGTLVVNANSDFTRNWSAGGNGGRGGSGVSGAPPTGIFQGNGAPGGSAFGGAIYAAAGSSLSMEQVSFRVNSASGGVGGAYGTGNNLVVAQAGAGGNANGGAIYSAVTPVQSGLSFPTNALNTVFAGAGGVGAFNNAPSGTAINPNSNF
jgi:hypothetical protein